MGRRGGEIPGVLRGQLMTCATVCPLGDGGRKSTLPLPLFDDAAQLAADIYVPTKLPDRWTEEVLKASCEHAHDTT